MPSIPSSYIAGSYFILDIWTNKTSFSKICLISSADNLPLFWSSYVLNVNMIDSKILEKFDWVIGLSLQLYGMHNRLKGFFGFGP